MKINFYLQIWRFTTNDTKKQFACLVTALQKNPFNL